MAGDISRHQVRRELDAGELATESLSQRSYQQRFAEARHAFDQDVAGRDQRREDLLNGIVLSNECIADLGAQIAGDPARLLKLLL